MKVTIEEKDFFQWSLDNGLVTVSPKGVITRDIIKTLQTKEGMEIAKKYISNIEIEDQA